MFQMSFRFCRRIRIAPGVTLDLSKSGGSLSFGPRGAKFTIGPRGKRATVGIPGTGLFYTTALPNGRSGGRSASYSAPTVPTVRPEDRLTLVSSSGLSPRTTRMPWWTGARSWFSATKRRPRTLKQSPSGSHCPYRSLILSSSSRTAYRIIRKPLEQLWT
ncbi:DUF4236 domain-containing protein [Methylacidiphilum caldifontis]|uniref:DUF4236 domain-containing protein n=1 Tax=Methylacidiphilum caldifontis TaxID=2795386 RepID=UPI001ABD21F4